MTRLSSSFPAWLTLMVTGCAADPEPERPPTWSDDVAPLVEERCAGCHRDGGLAPFAFSRYVDAAPRAELMAHVTREGIMPPFPPDQSGACRELETQGRVLSTEEMSLFSQWANAHAPEGMPGREVVPPTSSLTDALVLDTGFDYAPSLEVEDDYRCFLIDPELREDAFVTAFEARPGDRRVVHHIILFAIPDARTEAALVALDGSEPGPGYTCFGAAGHPSATPVGGWAPGTGASIMPPGTGIPLRSGRLLVLQVHYHPIDVPVADRTAIALRLASRVEREARFEMLFDDSLEIPPRAEDVVVERDLVIPEGTIWGVFPHMHELGRTISLEMTPSGSMDRECLISIPEWDFEWQCAYFFREPIPVGFGDRLTLRCVYDNPTSMQIFWGEGTEDEMCVTFLYVTD